MKFQYPFFQPSRRKAGPYLPVKITNPKTGKSIEWYGLVDTGVDSCLFTAPIVSYLGHNLDGDGVKSSVSCGMEGREVTTCLHTFRISLMHPARSNIVVWRSRKMLFECIAHDECPLLLGVDDFLGFFRVTIDYRKRITILQFPKQAVNQAPKIIISKGDPHEKGNGMRGGVSSGDNVLFAG